MENKDRDFLGSFDGFFNSLFSKSFFGKSVFDGTTYPKDDDKNFHKTEEVIETETHSIKREKWVSIDGGQVFEKISKISKGKISIKPTKVDLEVQLKEAIAAQEFEKACDLRDQIKKYKA